MLWCNLRPKQLVQSRNTDMPTSGSRTSETGGPNLCRNLSTTFFRRFPKKFQHYRKKFHLSLKISDDLFFSHRLFFVFCFNMLVFRRGAKSVAHIDQGAKILKFTQIHISIITVSAPEGGQTPLPTSIGEGPWPDLPPPWIRHWICLMFLDFLCFYMCQLNLLKYTNSVLHCTAS